MSDELGRIKKILDANSDKDFVKRILDPDNSPSIDMGGGYRGTHFMATMEADGKHYVFPTIQRMADGELRKMNPDEAFQQAIETNEVIAFDTAEEAAWFSSSYKKVWNKGSE
jgi:hypothetical protein